MGAPGLEVSHLLCLDSSSKINREKKMNKNWLNSSKDENSSEVGVVFFVSLAKKNRNCL